MKTANLSLIAAVNLATDEFGLYRAELARILGLNCADVSDSRHLALLLESNADVRSRAKLFVHFFQLLQRQFSNDSVKMVNWFRRQNPGLGTSPFLAIVDHDRLADLVDFIQATESVVAQS